MLAGIGTSSTANLVDLASRPHPGIGHLKFFRLIPPIVSPQANPSYTSPLQWSTVHEDDEMFGPIARHRSLIIFLALFVFGSVLIGASNTFQYGWLKVQLDRLIAEVGALILVVGS